MYFRGIHLLRLHLRRRERKGGPSKCERMQSWKGEGGCYMNSNFLI